MLGKWLLNVLSAMDRLANAITGGSGDETLSSRAGKGQREGKQWACILCRALDFIQKNHCARSINPDDGANATLPD